MALTVTHIVSGQNGKVSAASTTVTPGNTVAGTANAVFVFAMGGDNYGTSFQWAPTNITSNKGDVVFTKRNQGNGGPDAANGDGGGITVWTIAVGASGWAATDTITVTHGGNPPAVVWAVWLITPAAGQTVQYVETTAASLNGSTTLANLAWPDTTATAQFWFAAIENTVTFTSDAAWTALQTSATSGGSATTNQRIGSQSKTNGWVSNVTVSFSASDGCAIAVSFKEVTPNPSGTVAVTLASVVSAISATVVTPVTGTVGITLAAVTSSITATSVANITGTVAATLGNVTSAVVAKEDIPGTVARTLANVTSAITAAEGFTGTVARTLDSVTSVVTAAEGFTGTVARTLANVTSAISANTIPNVTGTVAKTLDGVTSAVVAAEGFTGTVARTLDNVTSVVTAAEGFTGTLARTLGNVTSAISATSILPPVTGTVARTLGNVTSTASGTVTIAGVAGNVAAILGNVVSTASATVVLPPPVTGTLARTLANTTSTATGTVVTPTAITGTLARILANVTCSASGSVAQAGFVLHSTDHAYWGAIPATKILTGTTQVWP